MKKSCNNPAECRIVCNVEIAIGTHFISVPNIQSLAELLIPPSANVYYAVSTQHDLNFILKEKHEDLNDCLGGQESAVDPLHTSTPKPRKGSRDTSKARRKLLGLQL